MADIIKKQGDEKIMSDPAVREHFIEELCDTLMYFNDVCRCYSITPEELEAVTDILETARTMEYLKPRQPEPEDPEETQAVEDTAYFQMRQRISELLSGLDEADAKLLTLRFGLEGGKPLSPEETGAKLGLTAEEVVAKEAAALAKLRSI